MSEKIDKTVLFSGRYSPCHLGHICSVVRLAKTYKKVLVMILDYEEREWPIAYTVARFEEVFKEMPGLDIEIGINDIHFGQITKEELKQFDFDVYAAGNLKVLRHMEQLGVECIYVDRCFLDQAREIQLPAD